MISAVEGFVDDGVGGEKSSSHSRVIEHDQTSFSASERLMCVLHPIGRATTGEAAIVMFHSPVVSDRWPGR